MTKTMAPVMNLMRKFFLSTSFNVVRVLALNLNIKEPIDPKIVLIKAKNIASEVAVIMSCLRAKILP